MPDKEIRFARLACLGLALLVLWQPLNAVTLVTWSCVFTLAGLAASLRVIGRLG